MKKLHPLLVGLALLVPAKVCADLPNMDFSNGLGGWTGDIKNAADLAGTDPDIPAGTTGMVVQLDPERWTQASLEFDMTSHAVDVDVEYSLVAHTKFSNSELKLKEGLTGLGFELPARTKPGLHEAVVGILHKVKPEQTRINTEYLPGEGTKDKRKLNCGTVSFDLPEKVTLVIGFPPGKGAVLVDNLSMMDPDTLRQEKKADPLAWTSGDEAFQNADFSDGTNHWTGDFKTPDTAGGAPAKGITIQLNPTTWTKVTQLIHPKMAGKGYLTMEYFVSPEFGLSGDTANYEKVPATLGFSDAQFESPKGNIILLIDSIPTVRSTSADQGNGLIKVTVQPDFASTSNVSPAADSQPHTLQTTLYSAAYSEESTFCIAVPPGQGSITITKLSLRKAVAADANSPGHPANVVLPNGQTSPQQPANP